MEADAYKCWVPKVVYIYIRMDSDALLSALGDVRLCIYDCGSTMLFSRPFKIASLAKSRGLREAVR